LRSPQPSDLSSPRHCHEPPHRTKFRRYLTALVAGDIDTIRDSFAEGAGRNVKAELHIAGPWHGGDQIVGDFLPQSWASGCATNVD
jgi:hypothetical protein